MLKTKRDLKDLANEIYSRYDMYSCGPHDPVSHTLAWLVNEAKSMLEEHRAAQKKARASANQILVVAGNLREFLDWASTNTDIVEVNTSRQLAISKGGTRYVYVSSRERVLGMVFSGVLTIGTYHKNPECTEILAEALYRIRP